MNNNSSNEGFKYYAFISYSHADKNIAKKVRELSFAFSSEKVLPRTA